MCKNIKYRNQVILVHHLAFNSIECRLSFLNGWRQHKDYMKDVFPFILNMLKNIDLKEVAEPAMIHMIDVIEQYATKLSSFYSDNSFERQELIRIAKRKTHVRSVPEEVLKYAITVTKIDNLHNKLEFDSFDLEKEFPWPDEMAGKLGLLDAAYKDYLAVENEWDTIIQNYRGDNKNAKKPAIATSIQLMAGTRDFMSHIGTAFQHEMQLQNTDNNLTLVEKNITNAENHLHHLIFDFIKISTLLAFHSSQYLSHESPQISLEQVLFLLKARHYEHNMIGKDFLERYQLFREAMCEIVLATMPGIKLQEITLEEVEV